MKSLEYLINIDYDNLTFEHLIKIKQNLTETLEIFDNFRYDYSSQDRHFSLFEITLKLTNLSEAAYGKLDNPMKDYLKNVREGVALLKSYDAKLPTHWILDNLDLMGKNQSFNPNILKPRTPNIQESKEKLEKLNETAQAINEMLISKGNSKGQKAATKMYKKALRKKLAFNETLFLSGQKFEFVTVDKVKIKIKSYSFENFQMIRSDDYLTTKNSLEGVYQKAIKKVFPEWYL